MKLTNWGRNLEDNRVAEDKPGWLFIALYIGICVEICKKSFKDLFFDLLSLLGGYACVARALGLNIKLGSARGLEFTVGAGILAAIATHSPGIAAGICRSCFGPRANAQR